MVESQETSNSSQLQEVNPQTLSTHLLSQNETKAKARSCYDANKPFQQICPSEPTLTRHSKGLASRSLQSHQV